MSSPKKPVYQKLPELPSYKTGKIPLAKKKQISQHKIKEMIYLKNQC